MRNLVVAEWLKARSGRPLVLLLALGTLMVVITCAGYAGMAEAEIEAGATPGDVTAATVRFGFMMLLFSGILGVLAVTREYASGAIGRSVLLSGRSSVFTAKAVVVTLAGVGFGVLAVAVGLASAWVLLPANGVDPAWTREGLLTSAGVLAVVTAAAPWGLAIGWLLRSQVGAVVTFLVLTLAVDEAVFRLVPSVGRFTMQIAMGAVYRDGKPEMLPVGVAAVVVVAWIVVVGAAARVCLDRHDVV